MCLSKDAGGRRCPCSGGVMPVPATKEEREERAEWLSTKRDNNATAADLYRKRQLVMVREATALVNSLDRVSADERAAAIAAALDALPERGAAQPRRVLEAALEKEWVPVPAPVTTVPAQPAEKESKALTAARHRLAMAQRAGASQESIDLIQRRIEKLTPKEKVETVPVPPVSEPDTAATASAEPDTTDTAPEHDADAAHAEALQRLHDHTAASRAAEDAAHAEAVAAAAAAVADIPNPFAGIAIPDPKTAVSIDEAFAAHMAREAAEERAREEQEARDASPRRAQVEANFFAFMDELRAP